MNDQPASVVDQETAVAAELVLMAKAHVVRSSGAFTKAWAEQSKLLKVPSGYYQLRDAPMRPLPVQKPRPPLMLGAHGPKMLRIIAEYADTWNSFGTVDEMRERNAILDEHCVAIGRDPSTIVRSLYGWAALMPVDPWASTAAYEDMVYRDSTDDGFDADMIDDFTPGSEFELQEESQRLGHPSQVACGARDS